MKVMRVASSGHSTKATWRVTEEKMYEPDAVYGAKK